jgi:hypothetical protein
MSTEQISLILCGVMAFLGIVGMRASKDDVWGFGGFTLMFLGLCMVIASVVFGGVLLLMNGWPF